MTVKEQIKLFLESKSLSNIAIEGIINNLSMEPNTDKEYTNSVDTDNYSRFVSDKIEYGIGKWKNKKDKERLYYYCKGQQKSISDLNCQLYTLFNEILDKSLLTPLKNAASVEEASNIFERREQL